jgi:hypothetical protein
MVSDRAQVSRWHIYFYLLGEESSVYLKVKYFSQIFAARRKNLRV